MCIYWFKILVILIFLILMLVYFTQDKAMMHCPNPNPLLSPLPYPRPLPLTLPFEMDLQGAVVEISPYAMGQPFVLQKNSTVNTS